MAKNLRENLPGGFSKSQGKLALIPQYESEKYCMYVLSLSKIRDNHTVMILSIQTEGSGQISMIRVFIVCHSICIFWMHCCLNFRVTTAIYFRCPNFSEFRVSMEKTQLIF